MKIKKIYEIEGKKEGKKEEKTNLLRCKSVLEVKMDDDGYGYFREYKSFDERTLAYLVQLENEITDLNGTPFTLINKNTEIIHIGIPYNVNNLILADCFIVYLRADDIIAIGSLINYRLKDKLRITAKRNIQQIPRKEWIDIRVDHAYYNNKLLIIRTKNTLDIYHADDLDSKREIKLNGENVLARCKDSIDDSVIHLCELDNKGFPANEYFFSVNDGKKKKAIFIDSE